jgi:hypothetical protein
LISQSINKAHDEILKSDKQLKSEKISDLSLKENPAIINILNQQGITYCGQVTQTELFNLRNQLPNHIKKLLRIMIQGEREGYQYQASILV